MKKINQVKCLNCSKEVDRKPKVYCNNVCQAEYQYKSWITRWLAGDETGVTAKYFTSANIKRYLREKYGNCCSDCGWNKVSQYTGKVPVQLDHRDGNFKNNTPDNVRLLCPSCHSLTPYFGGLNKGRGRKERYGSVAQLV